MSSHKAWEQLKSFTSARVALGKSGGSLTTRELLKFREDHALARDAVWTALHVDSLLEELQATGLASCVVQSRCKDREAYIKRPDLGRRLAPMAVEKLEKMNVGPVDIAFCIADGLSAFAIERHALPFLREFLPLIAPFKLSPVVVIQQGRVAISDEIGQLFQSKLSIILIGERPGLTSPDSLGVYMTYHPQVGTTDEKRNCISNIRDEGLPYAFAARKLGFLVSESIQRKLSGVNLKDTFDENQLSND